MYLSPFLNRNSNPCHLKTVLCICFPGQAAQMNVYFMHTDAKGQKPQHRGSNYLLHLNFVSPLGDLLKPFLTFHSLLSSFPILSSTLYLSTLTDFPSWFSFPPIWSLHSLHLEHIWSPPVLQPLQRKCLPILNSRVPPSIM